MRRHQVLRSVFRRLNGDLVQVVVAPEKQNLSVIDLSGVPSAEKEAQIRARTLEEADRPFDLTTGPLLRSTLIRLAPDDYILQITTHHLVHDDWSTGIFLRELSQIYQTLAGGAELALPELTFHYSDYVRWHRDQLQRQVSRIPFWKKQLSSETGFEHLPTDFTRPAQPSYQGARERVELPSPLVESLKELSRRERVSLFMVLLAGFQCLLRNYSGHDEIGIASCAANRPLGEVAGVMGRFGNDILLRTSLSGNPTFRELLVRVRDTALTAYADQNIPFGALLQNHENGSPDRLPFQIMFILQNAPKDYQPVPGLNINWTPLYNNTAKHDLIVWLTADSTLEAMLEYRTDLFRPATMRKVLEDYQAVLESAVKDPGARIDKLSTSGNTEPVRVPIIPQSARAMAGKNGNLPNDDVQSRLVELWQAAFNLKPIGIDQDFFELGGDSLLGARLFTQMETTFQVELPLTALLEAPTIRQLAEVIGGRKTRSSEVVVVVQSEGAKPPLFCVYGHGGGIFYFGILARSLGPDQPLYGLRLEGFDGADNTVEQIAAFYLREIRKIQPKGPYCLSGYCFGGMVAYEIASRLKIEGEEVALLVLFNSPAPGSLKGWPYSCLAKRFAYEARKLWRVPWKEKRLFFWNKVRGLWRMLGQSFARVVWRMLPGSGDPERDGISRRFLSGGNVNVVAAKAYRPPPYPGEIILFATDDIGSRYTIDPRRGWGDLAIEGIEIHPVAGDNVSFFEEGNVEVLGEKLRFCLERVYRKTEEAQLSDVMSAEALKVAAEKVGK
jgi:thioesterase domain-containing protein/acyl carrier protein